MHATQLPTTELLTTPMIFDRRLAAAFDSRPKVGGRFLWRPLQLLHVPQSKGAHDAGIIDIFNRVTHRP